MGEERKHELQMSEGAITELLHGSSLDARSAFARDIYIAHQMIVGMRFQGGADELLRDLKAGSRVTFLREPDNPYDKRAVMAVDEEGRRLGYIPKHQNTVISALMDAGKFFYGIVPEERRYGYYGEQYEASLHEEETSERDVPGTLFVELYMREFSNPEEMDRIPRQGEQGSYVVVDLTLAGAEPEQIKSIHAIKVINGEERASFHEWVEDIESRDEETRMIRGFDRFTGMLAIVGHQLEGEKEKCLSEAYGVLLGKAFSNRTIDTSSMVWHRVPELGNASLEELNEEFGLAAEGGEGPERNCRLTLTLYRRLSRSELERRSG